LLTFNIKQVFGGEHAIGRFRLSAVTGKRALQADPLTKDQRRLLSVKPEQRSKSQERDLFTAYRRTDSRFEEANKKIDEEQKKWPDAPKTLVLLEREEPRQTHIFKRGDFKKPLDEVNPGTPSILHALPQTDKTNRLALARWIVDKKNPLTPRVI